MQISTTGHTKKTVQVRKRGLVYNKRFNTIVFGMVLLRGVAQLLFTYKLLPNMALNIISAGVLFLILGFLLLRKERTFIVSGLLCFWIFLGYMVLNIVFNGTAGGGGMDAFSYSFYYIMTCFFAVQMLEKNFSFFKDKSKVLLKVFFCILFIQVTLDIMGLGLGRPTLGSILGHANSANLLLAYLIILAIWKDEFKWAALLFILMVLLGGRSSLISIMIISGAMVVIGRINSSLGKKLIIILAVLSVIVVFYWIIVSADEADWGESISLVSTGEGRLASLDSTKWRINHWNYYIESIVSKGGVLFGNGMGSHEPITLKVYERFYEVHNDFLKIAHDLGVVGLVLFLLYDISIGCFFARRIKKGRYVIVFLYVIRYSFMFFDNMATNFIDIILFTGLLYFFVEQSRWDANKSKFLRQRKKHRYGSV